MPRTRSLATIIVTCLGLAVGARGQAPPPPDQSDKVYEPEVKPASDEGREAIRRFRVPKGLEVTLFAAEPLLANPVAFAIDGKNRFYVAETFRHHAGVTDIRKHMEWLDDDLASRSVADRVAMYRKQMGTEAESYGVEHDRLKLVEDRDGDHRADHANVFADGFDSIPAGIGAGVLARGPDVWYTCIPDLWHLVDADGDGRADRTESLLTGFGVHVGFLGHDLHGPILGPDGKLYFSIGDRGFHVETEGRTVDVPDTGSVVRCDPDGSDFEVVHVGLRNPQELAFDPWGNLFTVDNNSDSGDKARVVHLIEGGDSGWRIGYQFLEQPNSRGPWNSEKLWYPRPENTAAYLVPPLLNLSDGPSGLAFEPGTALNDSARNRFFLADFRGGSAQSGVRSFRLEPSGASFKVVDPDQFLWSVLATDVEFGTDGALYVSDWVEGWEKPGKGRIYRVADPSLSDDPKAREVSTLLAEGLAGRPPETLVGLLAHDDMRIRREAQFALAARGPEAIPTFAAAARPGHPLLARVHALWGLGQVGRDDPSAFESLPSLLADPDAEVRAQTAKVLGDARQSESLDTLIGLLKDDSPRVRMFTALALGRLGKVEAVRPLIEMLRANADEDAYLRHAGIMGLVGSANLGALRAAMDDESAAVRMGVLLAFRRLGRPEVGRFLADPDPAIVLEAARAINDAPIEAALPSLGQLADRPGPSVPVLRRVVNANLRIGEAENAAALVRLAAREDVPVPIRAEALDALSQWAAPSGRDRIVGLWRPIAPRSADPAVESLRPALASMLQAAPTEVRAAACRAAGSLAIAEAGPTLRALVADASSPVEVATQALRALETLQDPGLAGAVRQALDSRDAKLRVEALRLLVQTDPDGAVLALEAAMKSDSVSELQGALEVLGRLRRDPAADTTLALALDRLIAGEVPVEVQLDLLDAASKRRSPEVREKLRRYEASRPKDDPLAGYLETLAGGDPILGRRIFQQKAEVSCLRCHKVEYGGGEVGPELNGIGKKHDRRYILESIVLPNAKIAEGFESVVVATEDGQVRVGVLKEDGPETLRLMTPEGEMIAIPKNTIEERKRGVSAMPEDLIKSLTKAELRDLIEYLSRVTPEDFRAGGDRSDSGGDR